MRRLGIGILLVASVLLTACTAIHTKEQAEQNSKGSPLSPRPVVKPPEQAAPTREEEKLPSAEQTKLPWEQGPLRELLLKAVAQPDKADGWVQLSALYSDSGWAYSARVAAERALALEPSDPRTLVRFGMACLEDTLTGCNEDGRGLKTLEKAAELAPVDQDVLLTLARGNELAGRITEAKAIYLRLAGIGNRSAHLALALLQKETASDLDGDGRNDRYMITDDRLHVTSGDGVEILKTEHLPEGQRDVKIIDLGAPFPVLWVRAGGQDFLYLWDAGAKALRQVFQGSGADAFYDPLERRLVETTQITPDLSGAKGIRWQQGAVTQVDSFVVEGVGDAGPSFGPRSIEQLALYLAVAPSRDLFEKEQDFRTFTASLGEPTKLGETPSLQFVPSRDGQKVTLVRLHDGRVASQLTVTLQKKGIWQVTSTGN